MRIRLQGVLYHIIARCNNGEHLLRESSDRTRVTLYLKHYCQKYRAPLYGYIVLPSHLHLVMETRGEHLIDTVMHDFCLAVALHFNRRHRRGGHFWRHRYRSRLITDDRYALACLGYVDRNAIAAGLVSSAADWPWCSYRYYAEGKADDLLTELPSYRLLGNNPQERQSAYRQIVHAPLMTAEDERLLFEGRFHRGSRRYTQLFEKCAAAVRSCLPTSNYLLVSGRDDQ